MKTNNRIVPMEPLVELIKITLPAALVLYAVFLTVRAFLNKEYEKKLLDIKIDSNKIALPLRLQAYERICLLLERISLNNLIIRVNDPMFNSLQLQQKLLQEVRNEFNHNLSQQVYMSDEAWNRVRKSVEDIIAIINTAGELVENDTKGIELAKKIFEQLLARQKDPVQDTLTFIKSEIRNVF